ncbi:MAG: putative transposase [Polaromonas sp.]|nr:putative transposase [Polaromonas sp.]
MLLKASPGATVIADQADGAHERVSEPLLQAGKAAVIPPWRTRRGQRSYDRHPHKAQHLIGSFFARLKQYRAIATR